jgi:predicted component of type VI protein secretion system
MKFPLLLCTLLTACAAQEPTPKPSELNVKLPAAWEQQKLASM